MMNTTSRDYNIVYKQSQMDAQQQEPRSIFGDKHIKMAKQ
jgi:hypothetical protein